MLPFASFIQPFLEYLRPTKSPYLVLMFAAVTVLCLTVSSRTSLQADRPEIVLIIYVLMACIVPLSLFDPKTKGQKSAPAEGSIVAEVVDNSKYENDFDAVMKFSRALNLACPIIMLYFYLDVTLHGFFAVAGYSLILAQMITFFLYISWRHFHAEEVLTSSNTFQIAFITATLFVGCTYTGL